MLVIYTIWSCNMLQTTNNFRYANNIGLAQQHYIDILSIEKFKGPVQDASRHTSLNDKSKKTHSGVFGYRLSLNAYRAHGPRYVSTAGIFKELLVKYYYYVKSFHFKIWVFSVQVSKKVQHEPSKSCVCIAFDFNLTLLIQYKLQMSDLSTSEYLLQIK